MNCICRQARELTGESCSRSHDHETCLSIGATALWLRRQGHARLVKKKVFLELLDRAEAEGLVLQPQNTQAPQYVCCCCSDCCEVLINARKFPRAAEHLEANYRARVQTEICSGCRICEKRCPMGAVTVDEEKARFDPDRCIGCGVCVLSCNERAVNLEPRVRPTTPPPTTTDLYKRIFVQRYGPLRLLGKAVRLTLGGKV
jgi:ferredoxin